jgi:hypothetical protein
LSLSTSPRLDEASSATFPTKHNKNNINNLRLNQVCKKIKTYFIF